MKNKYLVLTNTVLILSINSFAQDHVIGERFGGGIIFYVDSSGQHGLIADSSDQKKANWPDAVNECKELRDGDYTDWHLPSRDEADLFYAQIKIFDDNHLNEGVYWTATERRTDYAWVMFTIGGTMIFSKETDIHGVRAVRSF